MDAQVVLYQDQAQDDDDDDDDDDVDVDAKMRISPKCKPINTRALVEVFAVRLIGRTSDRPSRMGGLVLLKSCDKNHVLHEDGGHESVPQIDSKGYLTLVGPECGVEVEDVVVIYPWLFDKSTYLCNMTKGNTVWQRKGDDSSIPSMNRFIRKGIKSEIGFMEVDFAVYSDAVEARLEVIVSDLVSFKDSSRHSGEPFKVSGTIKASNGYLVEPEAKSVLFNVTHQDCITLSPLGEAEIALPLMRNVTVIPRGSALVVDVCLSCAVGDSVMFDCSSAVGSAVFDPRSSRLWRTVEEKIIDGVDGKVKIKVIWLS